MKDPDIALLIACMVVAFSVAVMILLPVPKPYNLLGFPVSGAVGFILYIRFRPKPSDGESTKL